MTRYNFLLYPAPAGDTTGSGNQSLSAATMLA